MYPVALLATAKLAAAPISGEWSLLYNRILRSNRDEYLLKAILVRSYKQ